MTQNQLIRQHLEAKDSLTPIDALNLYGVFRLAARVHQLRSEGMIIHSEMITNGKKKFAKYFIERCKRCENKPKYDDSIYCLDCLCERKASGY